jgi:hypothetical protein
MTSTPLTVHSNAIAEARRRVQYLAPVPWQDFEQATQDVLAARPDADVPRLVEILMDATFRRWESGLTDD